jgi:hypothetical protein
MPVKPLEHAADLYDLIMAFPPGDITGATLVQWAEKALAASGQARCDECGENFDTEDMIEGCCVPCNIKLSRQEGPHNNYDGRYGLSAAERNPGLR